LKAERKGNHAMSSKDFELIARTLASLDSDTSRADVASAFARALRSTNPRFDASRFITAASKES
jgi:hypothetical protein